MILIQTKKIERKNHNLKTLSETCVSKFIHIIVHFFGNATNSIAVLMILQLTYNLLFSFPYLIVLMILGLFLLVLASLSILFNGKTFDNLFGLGLLPLLLVSQQPET